MVSLVLLAAAAVAAPKVDGRINADEWKDAAVYDGMRLQGKSETFPVPTTTYVTSDGEKTYVAVKSAVPAPGLLARVMPKREGALARIDDTVTLALADGRTLAVNANGAVTASKGEVEGFVSRSTVTNGFWNFECALPKAAGELVDVGRNWPLADPMCGGQGPGRPTVGVTSLGLSRSPVPAADKPRLQVLEVKGGAVAYTVRFRVVNPSAEAVKLNVAATGNPVNSQPAVLKKSVELSAGASEEFTLKGAILDDELVKLNVGYRLADKSFGFARKTEVRPNYAGSPFVRVGNDADLVAYKFAYYPSFNKFRVKTDVSLVPGFASVVKGVVCKGVDAKGTEVFSRTLKPDAKGIADETFDVPDLRPLTVKSGNPEYRLKVTVEGLKDVSYEKRFYRHAMDWEGNKYGLSDVVVPPFTPMTVCGENGKPCRSVENGEGDVRVRTVLREHEMSSIGLFKQVKAPAKEGLTEPTKPILAGAGMQLVATIDGKDVLIEGKLTFEDSDSLVVRTFTATFDEKGLKGRVKGVFEYDGQLAWTLFLERGKVDALKLVIPFAQKEHLLMHACVANLRSNFGGLVPSGTGSVWNGSMVNGNLGILDDYLPYIWIGGPLRGLAVYGENDRGWVHFDGWPAPGRGKGPAHDQEAIRAADGAVSLVLNLVQKPFEFTEPREIRLLFMATPVKPMLANWRAYGTGHFYGAGWMWGCGPQDADVEPFDGTGEVWDLLCKARREGKYAKADLDATMKKLRLPGKPGERAYETARGDVYGHLRAGFENACRAPLGKSETVWYTNARGVDYGIPSGATYCDEWNVNAFMDMDRDFTCMSKRDYALDPNKAFQDYAGWWYRKMVLSGACDCLYWDDIYLSPNYDLVGTDSYLAPDGRIQPGTGVNNMRGLVKRCATVQAELGKNATNNWIHMTDTAIAPISAFAGVHYDMEDCPADGKAFQQKYPMEYLEAVSIGRQMGCRVKVMAHYPKISKEMNAWYERIGAGLMLCYEFRWKWDAWVFNGIMKNLEAWGYCTPAVRVWNYWNRDEAYPLDVQAEKLASIAMARKKVEVVGGGGEDGEAVVAVCDFSGEARQARVKLDTKMLGLKAGYKAYDFEKKEPTPITLEGDTVVFDVKPYDFRVIILK